jgi:AraC-like DNA-binding protein
MSQRSETIGAGLERSCGEIPGDWLRGTAPADGIELIEAWFGGRAYRKHRHDTYAIGLTDRGVQGFSYRGASHIALPGDIVVLHPDELHDGYAAAETGFGYRFIYLEPALIFDALRALGGKATALPFAKEPVVASPALVDTVRAAFRDGGDPLAMDDLVVRMAEGIAAAAGEIGRTAPARLDLPAISRARGFLEVETSRVVRSWELEAVTGLTRYELARQFRSALGTSPYRYSLMRRLAAARTLMASARPLVDVALETGFADQAHFTRAFSAAFGFSPARYEALQRAPGLRVSG